MTTRKKAVLGAVAALLALALFQGTQSCVRAGWERSRIKIGMSVSDVFHAINGWRFCSGSFFDPATKEFAQFRVVKKDEGSGYYVHVHGETEYRQIDSEEELIQMAQKQMSPGQSWSIQFTYFGYPRSTFRVDFDSHGKVQGVSGIGGGP